MSEHGILFSPAMVRALRAGTKSETRRLVTAGTTLVDGRPWPKARFAELDLANALDATGAALAVEHPRTQVRHQLTPRLAAGTRLWVREAFWLAGAATLDEARPRFERGERDVLRYVADEPPPRGTRALTPLFMPRWAARIALELRAVRFARLHALDAAAVRAEGIEVPRTPRGDRVVRVKGRDAPATYLPQDRAWTDEDLARAEFASGWNALHPRVGRWETNPWVLVLELEVRS